MKTLAATLALCTLALSSQAGTSVGVSIGIQQPGFYGRVDVGRVSAPPLLVYPAPVVIVPTPVVQYQSPIYLHVPPGHSKNWRRHCGYYGACDRPVYFVGAGWYRDHYRHHHHGPHAHHAHHGKYGKHGKHH